MWWPPLHWPIKMTTLGFQWPHHFDMGMDQYLLLIPFLGGWTSIYQLFWCSPGVQGFDTLPYFNPFLLIVYHFLPVPWMSLVLSKDRWSPIPHVFQGGYGPTTGRASSEDNSFFRWIFRWKFGREQKILQCTIRGFYQFTRRFWCMLDGLVVISWSLYPIVISNQMLDMLVSFWMLLMFYPADSNSFGV